MGGEQRTVREIGEVVVGGAVLELTLDIGVVGDSGDDPDHGAGLVGDRSQPTADGADRARDAHEAEVDDAGADPFVDPAADREHPLTVVLVNELGVDARPDGRGLVPGEVLDHPVGVDEPTVAIEDEHPDRQLIGEEPEGDVGARRHDGPGLLGRVGEIDRGMCRLGHPRPSLIR